MLLIYLSFILGTCLYSVQSTDQFNCSFPVKCPGHKAPHLSPCLYTAEVHPHDYSYHVYIRIPEEDENLPRNRAPAKYIDETAFSGPQCAGSLLRSDTILTAATCVVRSGQIHTDLTLVLLTKRLNETAKGYRIPITAHVVVHHKYNVQSTLNEKTQSYYDDIALVRLPIDLLDYTKLGPDGRPVKIEYVKLPPAGSTKKYFDDMKRLQIAGWAYSPNTDSLVNQFITTQVRLLKPEECANDFAKFSRNQNYHVDPARMKNLLCAISNTNVNIATVGRSDVGAGLITASKHILGVATGPFSCEDTQTLQNKCPNGPSFFTRVSKYKKWIEKNMS